MDIVGNKLLVIESRLDAAKRHHCISIVDCLMSNHSKNSDSVFDRRDAKPNQTSVVGYSGDVTRFPVSFDFEIPIKQIVTINSMNPLGAQIFIPLANHQ